MSGPKPDMAWLTGFSGLAANVRLSAIDVVVGGVLSRVR